LRTGNDIPGGERHAALPGDGAEGKRLHDANCMGCHDTALYTVVRNNWYHFENN
jgi:cytochrome c5